MSHNFLDQLKDVLDDHENVSVAENGAIGFKTAGHALLDMNFAVASMRDMSDTAIVEWFAKACGEDLNTAIVWLFFARDVRGGLGERRLFRVCMRYLAREFPVYVRKVLPLIAEYGRWDDVVDLLDTNVKKEVINLIRGQLTVDMKNMSNGKSVSLLAKWMPSENASSYERNQLALRLSGNLNISPRDYRVMLSGLRKHIGVIERKMSSGQWKDIDYEAVPSRANLVYNHAFLRHDERRRRKYLDSLSTGEAKINASTLFPHDIVARYACQYDGQCTADPALEAMWGSLANTVNDNGQTIVVADGSRSMNQRVGGSNHVRALDVANALSIYFAQRLSGPYHNRYITFSRRPQLVNLNGASTLAGKLQIARGYNEVDNTNVEAVFDLILSTAIGHRLSQEEMPRNILIISDMEFDDCAVGNNAGKDRYHASKLKKKLFDEIAQRYAKHGYRLPRLAFWNVCSRTNTIPVMENDLGVALVSGFSPNVASMVMSGEVDPYKCLISALDAPRYDPVRFALASVS